VSRDDKHYIIASLIARMAAPRFVYALSIARFFGDESGDVRVIGVFNEIKQAKVAL